MLNFLDPSFKAFSAPLLIKLYCGLCTGLLTVGWLMMLIVGLLNNYVAGAIVLILGPVLVLFLLLGTRIVCEWIIATILIAENTEKLVDLMGSTSAPAPAEGAMFGSGPLQRYLSAPPLRPTA